MDRTKRSVVQSEAEDTQDDTLSMGIRMGLARHIGQAWCAHM